MTGSDRARQVWRHSDRVAHVESPGRVALASLSDLAVPPMLLTDTAAAIWMLLDGSRDLEAVVTALAEAFEVEESDIRDEVIAFVDDLAARDLIVLA